MWRHVTWSISLFALAVIGLTPSLAQTQPSSASAGLELLTRVAKKYGEAKAYYIESVKERESNNDFRRDWSKTILTAAQATGNRFHYGGRSDTGIAERVSDGKTVWTYVESRHRYTAKPYFDDKTGALKVFSMSDQPMMEAEGLHRDLADLAKPFKSAERLPDAKLKIDGHKVSCAVVRVRSSDQKRVSPGYTFEKTIWIDREHDTVLKVAEHVHTYITAGPDAGVPIEEETITTFTHRDLEGPIRDDLFAFAPPMNAKLIEDFPNPIENPGAGGLAGEQVPPLKLKSADGKITSLDSFRGRPVLIDIWATWCEPCVKALPELAKIYEETRDKGLVLVSVDRDEEAKTAADFLAKKGYSWPDFHDDGDIENMVGPSGIPRIILVDAQGKIVYDSTGLGEDGLRIEIAKLGPEYASLRPKPKGKPCDPSRAEAITIR